MNDVFIGIFAGLISAAPALLLGGTEPLAGISFCLSLFPILIVTLGWRHQAGLVAAMTGAIVCSIGGLAMALVYLVCIGLPAWGLAYLSLLGRRSEGGMEWYPVGHLLFWMVGATTVQRMVPVAVAGGASYEGYLAYFKEQFEPALQVWVPQLEEALARSQDTAYSTTLIATLAPAATAPIMLGLVVATVWFAARIVARTQRLPRPLPPIPAMRMPYRILLAVAGSFALSPFLDGLPAMATMTLFTASFMAIGLQGLASLHTISRPWPQRQLVLWVAYIAFLFLPIGNALIALFGAADILFNIRKKSGANGSPPANTSN